MYIYIFFLFFFVFCFFLFSYFFGFFVLCCCFERKRENQNALLFHIWRSFMDLISIGWLLGKVRLNPNLETNPRVFPGKVPDHCRSTEFGPDPNWCKVLVVFEAAICMIVLALLQEQILGFLPKNSKKSAPSQIPGHKVR